MDYEYRYSEDCPLKESCLRHDRIGCDVRCPIQPEFMYLFDTSNIPNAFKRKKFLCPARKDTETFKTLREIQIDIENFVTEGRFLYLWSKPPGTGKTSLVCKLLKTYLAVICMGNGFKDRAYFAYVPSLLLLAKDFENKDRDEILTSLGTLDLVILDDLGTIANTEYDLTILSNIIDTRYREGKATIVTSNLSPKDLIGVVGERIQDRVCSDIVLELKSGGRRKSTNTYQRRKDT